jgi:hypothetical protein
LIVNRVKSRSSAKGLQWQLNNRIFLKKIIMFLQLSLQEIIF